MGLASRRYAELVRSKRRLGGYSQPIGGGTDRKSVTVIDGDHDEYVIIGFGFGDFHRFMEDLRVTFHLTALFLDGLECFSEVSLRRTDDSICF